MPQLARQSINLSAIEYRANPFREFGRLREMGAVVPVRIPWMGKFWMVTTYSAVDDVLKNDKLFCRAASHAGRTNSPMLRMLMPGMMKRLSQNMLAADEPDHRRLRSLVDQAFQRHTVSDLQPRMEELTARQIEHVLRLARQNGGTVDLVEHLARPIPLAVICELLGLPSEDQPKFKKWFSSISNIKSMWGVVRVLPGLSNTMKYLSHQFDIVRKNPGNGLISALVQAEQAGDRLSDDELLSMVMLLLIAGHETTVHLISTSILTLLQCPEESRELRNDWNNVESAVEELLRYNSPAQFAKPRFVTEDVEFHGQKLKRGESVLPILASANCDPIRFDNPTTLILDRPKNYHLGFGTGPHVCLGLKLARAETQIVLEQLFTQCTDLKLAFKSTDPDWARRMGLRSLKSLMVHC